MTRSTLFPTQRPLAAGGLALMLFCLSSGVQAQALSATVSPEVLHRFRAAADDTARKPFAPPVWIPGTQGRAATLIGTTMEGGVSFGIPLVPGFNIPFAAGMVYTLPADGAAGYVASDLGAGVGQPISTHLRLPDGRLFAASTNASSDPAQEGSARAGVLFHLDGTTPVLTGLTQDQSLYYRGRGQLAADGAGNVYFGSTRLLMRRNADGSVQELVDFNQFTDSYVDAQGRTQTYLTHGSDPQIMVWSERDQALYIASFLTNTPHNVTPPDPQQNNDSVKGFLIRISGQALARGVVRDDLQVLHRFYGERDKTPYASDTKLTGMVEDGDWLYGTATTVSAGPGTIWRINKTAPNGFQTLHVFTADTGASGLFTGSPGLNPRGPLVRGADGNIYGTVERLGATSLAGTAIGAIYRIKVGAQSDRSDDALEVLHGFPVTEYAAGMAPVGLSAGPIDGTTQWLYGASEKGGGAANAGIVYRFAIDLPPVRLTALTVNDAAAVEVADGSRVLLSWTSEGASTCEPTGEWAGSGAKAASGSEQTAALSHRSDPYVFGLLCSSDAGLQSEEQQVSVTVQAPTPQPQPEPQPEPQPTPDTSSGGDGGGGGALGGLLLPLLAGLARRRHRH